jgi:hypothetical protein
MAGRPSIPRTVECRLIRIGLFLERTARKEKEPDIVLGPYFQLF